MNNQIINDPAAQYKAFFEGFYGREEKLATIIRYKNYQMLFPTNLCSHQHQVAAITRHLIGLLKLNRPGFDCIRTLIQAYIHDDHEPFMSAGDFQSADRVHLNAEQKIVLQTDECRAIAAAISLYPVRISSYSYDELLWDVAYSIRRIESQLVKLADNMGGLGEALHEIYSGNTIVSIGVKSQRFGVMNVSPVEYYRNYFLSVKTKLPLLADACDFDEYWFLQSYPENTLPREFYDLWVTAIKMYAPEWEQKRLFSK